MKLFLGKLIVTVGVGLASLFGYHQTPIQSNVTFGDFNPTGGQTYRLKSSISSTQTSITLSSFKEPVSNIPYTMSYLNSSIMYGTLDPQNNNLKEFISFTGITQNSDGSALLTGVTRGLAFSYPYTASTTLRQAHPGQSIFILSNTPQFYGQYYNLSNVSTSTNTLIFGSTTPPRYDLVPANQALGTYVSTTSELASVALVNAVLSAGCAIGTEGVTGCVRLATQLQTASSTFAAGTPTVLYSKYSTSSPYTSGLWIPITRNDGKLSPLFIATTSSDLYVWGGSNIYNASTTANATTTLQKLMIATTSTSFINGGFLIGTSTYFGRGVGIGVATTTTNPNLVVSGVASSSDLVVSNACSGCPMYYTSSSTAYTISSGAITFTGSIPTNATNALIQWKITFSGSRSYGGTANVASTGLTTATVTTGNGSGSTNQGEYSFQWSGSNLVVTEVTDTDTNASITGTVYWYK